MEFKKYIIKKDLVVVGAGIPGICAAIQAARQGLSVALINNRSYLGGNASPEVYVNINGADGSQEFNLHSRATGIVGELYLENLHRNPKGNRYIQHAVFYDWVKREKSIELFLNTNIDRVETMEMKPDAICYVSGAQIGSEKRFDFYADYFVDDTGDGTIGYLAGADYKLGRECKAEYGERIAPDVSDEGVLPCSLRYLGKDTGEPVEFIPPDAALKLSDINAMRDRVIPKKEFHSSQWYYSVGGNQIEDTQENIEKHWALVYGIWDHIKNSGEYDSRNYDFEYIAGFPGKRESRRLMGGYVLTERDVVEQVEFEDNIGFGGWSIDLHAIEGFFSGNELKNKHYLLKGTYDIPYRTLYSRNIKNLFIVGRCMSVSHAALGTARVMGTLGILGQGAGAAAYLCRKYGINPGDIYPSHIKELQQLLLKHNMQMIGVKNSDPEDLALHAEFTVSSVRKPELTTKEGSVHLKTNVGISMPANGRVNSVSFLLKAVKNTVLAYKIYIPLKARNFNPEGRVLEGKIEIQKANSFEWVSLPIDLSVEDRFLFIELVENPDLELEISNEKLTGVYSASKSVIKADNIIDIDSLVKRKFKWVKLKNNLCFRMHTDTVIYGAENINNGYARPYGRPNLWISDNRVEDEYLIADFKEKKQVKEIILRFDPDLNFRIFNASGKHEFNAIPEIVKDYSVYYHIGGSYQLLKEVSSNYSHANWLTFEPVETDKIKVIFKATNGSPCVGIYEMRIY